MKPKVSVFIATSIADYSHVRPGPVTLLVGYEANYSIDNTDNRLGLLYNRNRPLDGDLSERLHAVFVAALKACVRLEDAPLLRNKVKFSGEELSLVLNDRLLAPNTQETFTALDPTLKDLFNTLYGGGEYTIEHNQDAKQLFSLSIKAKGDWAIPTLLKNIENSL